MTRGDVERLLEYIDLRIREEIRAINPPKRPAGWEPQDPPLLSQKLRGPLIEILSESK